MSWRLKLSLVTEVEYTFTAIVGHLTTHTHIYMVTDSPVTGGRRYQTVTPTARQVVTVTLNLLDQDLVNEDDPIR